MEFSGSAGYDGSYRIAAFYRAKSLLPRLYNPQRTSVIISGALSASWQNL